jgi:hypothetical protein
MRAEPQKMPSINTKTTGATQLGPSLAANINPAVSASAAMTISALYMASLLLAFLAVVHAEEALVDTGLGQMGRVEHFSSNVLVRKWELPVDQASENTHADDGPKEDLKYAESECPVSQMRHRKQKEETCAAGIVKHRIRPHVDSHDGVHPRFVVNVGTRLLWCSRLTVFCHTRWPGNYST